VYHRDKLSVCVPRYIPKLHVIQNRVMVAIGIAGASASVEATQLGMGIGSAPEGANLGTSAEAPESGNGPAGIKTLYIAL
jgi:hypothetical protein